MLELEEKRFGRRSTNQNYYRTTGVKDRSVDIKKKIYIDSNGKAKIVLDVLNLDRFSIAISNLSKADVFLQTRVSPDGVFYKNVNYMFYNTNLQLNFYNLLRHNQVVHTNNFYTL